MATAASATAFATTAKVGFWIRVVAFLIDGVVTGIVAGILNSILFGGDAVRGRDVSRRTSVS